MSLSHCWASALKRAGASDSVVNSWQALRSAVSAHQNILAENGIGREVSERDRIRVNARRVGLEAPMFADEAAKAVAAEIVAAKAMTAETSRTPSNESFSDVLNAVLNTRHANQQQQQQGEGGERSTEGIAAAGATN